MFFFKFTCVVIELQIIFFQCSLNFFSLYIVFCSETSNGVVSETVVSSKSLEKETSTGSDEGTASPNCTLRNMPNEQNNSVTSFVANAEVSEEQKLDNTKPLHSSLAYDNRSLYLSSVGLVSI